jgi:murein DD-endopeptidase MepM/ murein hydrolase activator NlpD
MKDDIRKEWSKFSKFISLQAQYWSRVGKLFLGWTDEIKKILARLMYRQRGRFSQSFVNVSMASLFFLAIVLSGKVEELMSGNRNKEGGSGYLIMAQDGNQAAGTLISDSLKGEVTEYRVQDGDTVSSIALKFGVSIDTIVWENNLKSVGNLKPQQILRILPVTGVKYKVSRGETIYSIAKKFQVDAQNIIDYPFNAFADDEKFSLLAGQDLVIPDGVKPNEAQVDTPKVATKRVEPIPGVKGEGNFMWPTSGHITQKYYWYHQAVDIANPSNPPVVAAQGGTVVVAGWNGGGYGNYVIIDHGNGYQTLYGHMLNKSVLVQAGNRVTQGQRLGTMGSTGRSTGTHLHFEVRKTSGAKLDPLTVLK